MTRLATIITLAIASLCLCSCRGGRADGSEATLVADTVRYKVAVSPADPSAPDDVDGIVRLDVQALVDSLFASVYSHRAEVHSFESGKRLTIDDLKTMELSDERYSRDKVSVLQFTEQWSYNAKRTQFTKKVLSVHIAYRIDDEYGVKLFDRSGFVITMKQ